MSDDDKGRVTKLLVAWSQGNTEALGKLMPLVYRQLRLLARQNLQYEREDHTLQSRALIHEAFLKFAGQTNVKWQNRAQFFAIAAQAMRRILVDYARSRKTGKRRGEELKVSLSEAPELSDESDIDFCALDEALKGLSAFHARQCRVVELRYFGGLTVEETAHVLEISPATVKEDWRMAKAWLFRELARK